jgi:hypothetical protein
MRLLTNFFERSVDPQRTIIRSIEWIIVICTFLAAVYLFTPLYGMSLAASGPGVVASSWGQAASVYVWGAIMGFASASVAFGKLTHRPQFKSVGWFTIFLARFFQVLSTLIVTGPFPITWIYPFTLMLIVIMLWVRARYEVYQRATS